MSRAPFWYRTTGLTAWALVVLAALKSEPIVHRLIGDQHALTGYWCGSWGCIASLPKLLAWQVPAVLVIVPSVWMITRSVAVLRRNAGLLALLTMAGTAAWLIVPALQAWHIGQISSAADLYRFLVFSSIAGTTLTVPVLLASVAMGAVRVCSSGLRSDADTGATSEQSKDLGNVVVPHVDATA